MRWREAAAPHAGSPGRSRHRGCRFQRARILRVQRAGFPVTAHAGPIDEMPIGHIRDQPVIAALSIEPLQSALDPQDK